MVDGSTQLLECAEELGATGKGVADRGRGRPDFRDVLSDNCAGSLVIWVGDVGDVPTH